MNAGPRRCVMSALGVAVVIVVASGCGADPSDSDSATGTAVEPPSTARPPWPAPVDGVPELVERAGLDLGPMGTAEHYHPTLRIVVDGEEVPIPPNIGVDVTTGAMSAVHTHEGDGTIHIEADRQGEAFTLGQLFTQWNVALDRGRVGGATDRDDVSITSNGQPVTGDPADLQLRPNQDIVLEVS